MIRALVVDDEVPAREELIYILKSFKEIEVVGEASYGKEALELEKQLNPDLIFLDIDMPGLNGIEVAQELVKSDSRPFIVFVTAYEAYAIKAFEVNAIDYILKPISEERLEKSIKKILNSINRERESYFDRLGNLLSKLNIIEEKIPNKISLNQNGTLIPINIDEIIYATIEDKNTVVYTDKGRFQINATLGELKEKLNSPRFFRSHKSYLVNLDAIEAIEPWFNSTFNLKIKNTKEKILVSRSQSKEFKKIMNID
ncbi:LytR/AlgR family response regulator transcription factor [Wansuia hejianensis]|uniref:Stage 0 sporulation protein A homolog n=1 Tax=Wansuia hejianensis TaxID=2763667 RepID=A0A926EYP6_9FIRM|nr:LytTR family DNA-binding domain-containing protein [Wansuia hejianensis]MBC8590031.1 response regulator transcription factor [Wansuia hejianensis]